jgi:PKD repeat protein
MSVACFDNIRLKTLTISVKRTDSETWETLNTTELDTYHKVTDIEVDTSSFTTGQYEFKAIVTDAYGNESTAKSVTYSFKTSTLSAPVLTTTGAGWRAELSWTMTNTEDIAGYYIYRHALTENAFKHIAGVTRTSFTDKNVNAGEKYFYRIEAIDTYGNSTVSEDVSVVPTHEDEIKPMASAGSDLLAIAGESVSFDGSKSLDNNYVESYSWDFGDGTTASSASASHTYAEKGTYNATLTVTDSSGNTASDTVSVTVYGSENDKFTIKTMSGGAKLPRVNIICDEILGKGARAYTNSNGEYTFIAPEGEYTLMLYADGHLPITQTVKSSETTTIKLIEKKFVEGKLTARELDYNEIVTLGIDTTDPANRYVFEYIVRADHKVDEEGETFTVIRTNAKGDIITDNDNSGLHETYIKNGFAVWDIHNEESFGSGGYGGGSDTGSGGSGGGGGGGKNNAGTYYGQYATEKLKTFKTIAFMQINTDITWLKGFYSVDLIIMNNADEDFYIDHALASIILPDGLSLANTADINPETKTIGRIVGGETKVISWMVRGDIAGSYDIFAQFTGSLEPFGVPIEIEFKTESPVVVEDGNTLYLNIVHDLWSEDNDVWKIDYKLTNAGETPVYDLQFEIIAEYAENCGMDIEKIEIYQIDREGPDVIRWEDGKPKIDDMESRFNPLTEGIPDSTINLDPDEYLEFTVFVTKE